MMETIGSLIRYIVIIIFLSTILEMVLPEGVFRRYLRMLVGILLILTLLTPLQKIMRIAPYWETPFLSKASSGETELEGILQKGEEIYGDNIGLALQEYRYRIFSLLEGELAGEFGQRLLRLELSIEEDPESREFGSLQNIYAAMRKETDPDPAMHDEKIKKVRIAVEVSEKDGNFLECNIPDQKESSDKTGIPVASDRFDAEAGGNDQELEIQKFIATYFQLPFEKVEVEILP